MTLLVLDSVASTMDAAREHVVSGELILSARGPAPYTGVLALEQTSGRGQRGREWYSPAGESLCVTYFLPLELVGTSCVGQLALLAGVAVADVVRDHAANSGVAVGLKWPNDLYLNGKKAAGVLIEVARTPDGREIALVGVGVNIGMRSFPPQLAETATSLAMEGVPPSTPTRLGEAIAASLYAAAARCGAAGREPLLDRWRGYDVTAGRRYEADVDGATVTGVAAGIDSSGALLLRLSDGIEIAVQSATALREPE